MAASKYNGVLLPALPKTTYPHLLILNTTDDSGNQVYALWVCDQPFKASIDYRDTFCRPKDSNVEAYIANTTSWRWNRAGVSTSGDSDADFISIYGEFVWANHNIFMQNSLPPTMPTWDQPNFPYLLLQQDNYALWFGDSGVSNMLPVWWAWYSAEPFVLDDLLSPEVGELAGELDYGGFRYTTDVVGCQGYYLGTTFGPEGWTTMSNTEITARLRFDPEEPINNTNFWANHDIVGTKYEIKANSWFELLCYKASEPEAVIVQAPVITSLTGGGTYDKNAAANALTCTATSPDGGSLSYKWYRYTEQADDAVVCDYDAQHTPSTAVAGIWHYFCEVTNTQYGGTATVQSDNVTVTVNAVETETVTVGKSAAIMGYVLRLCGVPMAELVAEMLCKTKTADTSRDTNFSDFSGEYDGYTYRSAGSSDGLDVDETIPFAVSEFPLVLEHTFAYERKFKPIGSLSVELLPRGDYVAQAGDHISVTWRFPNVEWGMSQTVTPNWQLTFYGESGAYYSLASYNESTQETSFPFKNDFLKSVISNPVISLIEEDGKMVGFTASGDVIYNIKKIRVYHSSNLDYTTGSGTTVVTYNSADDFKVTLVRE